jgi:hypothetical protein
MSFRIGMAFLVGYCKKGQPKFKFPASLLRAQK